VDLRHSPADEAFRAELRAWLAEAVPRHGPDPGNVDWPTRRAYDTAWQATLHDAGYAGLHWPVEHGGRGASATRQLVYLEEYARARAPYISVNFVGLMHAGPTLIAEGTPEQKSAHLARILRGDEIWCQGFSEPGAGSDLASLRTRAVRDGDHYVVSGQKIWCTRAQVADYCELLVRTDPDAPKHRGITWLILPMHADGVEVRPIRTIDGDDHFCELFLDEVRVPVTNRVGEENDGWRVANVTLSFERGTGFVGELLDTTNVHAELVRLARELPGRRGTAWDDDGIRTELACIAAELDGLWAFTKRNVSQGAKGTMAMGSGSAFKVAYAATIHRIGDVALRILDRPSLTMSDLDGRPTGEQVLSKLHAFGISLGGGTTQIQQNIIAERVLGLPRER